MDKSLNLIKVVNRIFERALEKNFLSRTPLFWRDYHSAFPSLKEFEEQFPLIRSEVGALLQSTQDITDVRDLGGRYTDGGIHTIQWKSYLLKMGSFVEENCRRCPETTMALKKVPGVHLAFFSILFPNQYIKPHFGYYRGFLRYHLGIVIPGGDADNREKPCWLRINDDAQANRERKRKNENISKGQKYYWRAGEGVVFDDTLLHDAANESDEIRVVLWVDIRRPMPIILDWIHGACISIAMLHPTIRRLRRNAIVRSD